jgi:hypothetical protein
MHMGIPVYKRVGIAEKFAYGDPITHNEIVRIWGLTHTRSVSNLPATFLLNSFLSKLAPLTNYITDSVSSFNSASESDI